MGGRAPAAVVHAEPDRSDQVRVPRDADDARDVDGAHESGGVRSVGGRHRDCGLDRRAVFGPPADHVDRAVQRRRPALRRPGRRCRRREHVWPASTTPPGPVRPMRPARSPGQQPRRTTSLDAAWLSWRALSQNVRRPPNWNKRPIRIAPGAYESPMGRNHCEPYVVLTLMTELAFSAL